MKFFKALIIVFALSFLSTSCFEDSDDSAISSNQINDFVWKGMNVFYLYKDEVQKLSDDEFGINGINNRYGTNADYDSYLNSFASPFDLFNSLKHDPNIDRFSWIVDDYIALEQQFQGTSGTNGIEFSLFASPNSDTEGFGVIRLVLPNSPADNNNLMRGDIFYGIDGQILTNDNLGALLNQETYTLNLGFYNDKGTPETTDDSIDPLNEDVTISKIQYTENPIFKTEIINVGGENVGYLMYNGFIAGSENELNTVLSDFIANNVQHLVLDLRYNPGGSVRVETYLASMISGQNTGQLFTKLIRNNNFESTDYLFVDQFDGGGNINSLGLDKVYVLTTSRSASASEGLINGLSPYIEVVQIGTNTTGKTQASVTLYDSPNFTKEGINQSHTYAMQPLIATGVNKDDVEVPGNGLTPTIGFEYEESPLNYGVLGNVNEPMLALALADIENSTNKFFVIKSKSKIPLKLIKDSNDFNPFEGGMIID